MNKQKLKKLINNPRAFFKDSKFNMFNRNSGKRIALHHESEKREVEHCTKVTHPPYSNIDVKKDKNLPAKKQQTKLNIFEKNGNTKMNLKPIQEQFNFDYMIEKLKKYDLSAVYIKPLDETENLKSALVILDSHYEHFITKFLSFVFEENFTFKYKIKNEVKVPVDIQSFWSDIAKVKFLDIRLATNRIVGKPLSYFWFRLEIAKEENDFVMLPTNNIYSRKLYKNTIKQHNLFNKNIKPYSIILEKPHETEITFDIDLVFTWVNSNDEDWQKMYQEFKLDSIFENQTDAVSASRFLSRDELKYSLRSWEKYGSFIRNIYIVSNCKAPEWLNIEHPKIKWIDHKEIIPMSALPTFSSHAIEACLHNISSLSNYFIYCNDDILLTRPLSAYTFYHHNGIAKLRMEAYGNVNGEVADGAPDYLNAARNGTKLLEIMFGQTPTQLHTHSPQSMRKDLLIEMNQKFQTYFDRTIHNKFRDICDISVTSYLYQHYALLSGRALHSNEKTELIIERHDYKHKFNYILQQSIEQNFNQLPISVCINDGANSHLNEEWNKEILLFLNTLFPEPSDFEKK